MARKRPQAERANPQQVALHIRRQRAYGEMMRDSEDTARDEELICTACMLLLVLITLYFKHEHGLVTPW